MARTPKDEKDQSVNFEETQPDKIEDTPSQSQTAAVAEPESPQAQQQAVESPLVEPKVVVGGKEMTLQQVKNRTLDVLKAEGQTSVVIPKEAGIKQTPYDVAVNGVLFRLVRGERTSVPNSVYEIIMNSDDAKARVEKEKQNIQKFLN